MGAEAIVAGIIPLPSATSSQSCPSSPSPCHSPSPSSEPSPSFSRWLQHSRRNLSIPLLLFSLVLFSFFPARYAWTFPPSSLSASTPRIRHSSSSSSSSSRSSSTTYTPLSAFREGKEGEKEEGWGRRLTTPRAWPPLVAEGQEEEEEEEKEGEREGGSYSSDQEEEDSKISLGEMMVAKGREPHPRRARFELHKRWQSVTSIDIVEDGQILGGAKKGLPEQTFLRWLDEPRNVLLLMKRGSCDILQRVADITNFLQAREGVRVLVERQVKHDLLESFDIHVAELQSARIHTHHEVDLVITLGGDGLLMHANWLFQKSAPIILPVNLGSLGFLLPFEYEDIYPTVERVLTQDVNLTLRMRLRCRIIRNGSVVMDLAVMNDAVVERGSSPYLASLDCFCNGQYVTTVQADGLIIATPTGSTAYSMSAGGSMVHPGIQALLLTPICPHSLSFRPLIFPDSAIISLCMPQDVRSHAWVSFDGRFRHRLMDGDVLEVSNSEYPLPTVTHQNVTADWFRALNKAFNFNMRTRQKPL